jgi:hypothetical protein
MLNVIATGPQPRTTLTFSTDIGKGINGVLMHVGRSVSLNVGDGIDQRNVRLTHGEELIVQDTKAFALFVSAPVSVECTDTEGQTFTLKVNRQLVLDTALATVKVTFTQEDEEVTECNVQTFATL